MQAFERPEKRSEDRREVGLRGFGVEGWGGGGGAGQRGGVDRVEVMSGSGPRQ